MLLRVLNRFSLGCRGQDIISSQERSRQPFSGPDTWNGWDPSSNTSWQLWVLQWGQGNNSKFDTDSAIGSASGWPAHWKGIGQPNFGVPPPPWAFVKHGYGKPQYCFFQPKFGECDEKLERWGYNPTWNQCQQFPYSGCGGNQNNFWDKQSCEEACVRTADTDCQSSGQIRFEELLYTDLLDP